MNEENFKEDGAHESEWKTLKRETDHDGSNRLGKMS
jgi:hypothetical protein